MSSSGCSRLAAKFATIRRRGRGGLGAYLVAGDPDLQTTARCIKAMASAGAELIEVGFPFSDPVGDGPSIQAGHIRSLASGTTLRGVIDCVRDVRRDGVDVPIVLMGYLNPLHAMGFEPSTRAAAAAGVDGFIVIDQPLEESGPFSTACANVGVANILLAAPTTSEDRLRLIGAASTGFIYMASKTGTTGSGSIDCAATLRRVADARRLTDVPIAVGFGVRNGGEVAEIVRGAELAVVGTAVVEAISASPADPARAAAACVRSLLSGS